jgi:hypothetical protein
MIGAGTARRLRAAGLAWTPASGDAFVIDAHELDDQVFYLSDLTVELYDFDTGPVLGFNGTTEWALDSVAQEQALWLPREDQLREHLGAAFTRLERDGDDHVVVLADGSHVAAPTAADAYAAGLLLVLTTGDGGKVPRVTVDAATPDDLPRDSEERTTRDRA